MTKYKCENCGYSGSNLIFQINIYTYCVDTNAEEHGIGIKKSRK